MLQNPITFMNFRPTLKKSIASVIAFAAVFFLLTPFTKCTNGSCITQIDIEPLVLGFSAAVLLVVYIVISLFQKQ